MQIVQVVEGSVGYKSLSRLLKADGVYYILQMGLVDDYTTGLRYICKIYHCMEKGKLFGEPIFTKKVPKISEHTLNECLRKFETFLMARR